jgi:hypothetical protein
MERADSLETAVDEDFSNLRRRSGLHAGLVAL